MSEEMSNKHKVSRAEQSTEAELSIGTGNSWRAHANSRVDLGLTGSAASNPNDLDGIARRDFKMKHMRIGKRLCFRRLLSFLTAMSWHCGGLTELTSLLSKESRESVESRRSPPNLFLLEEVLKNRFCSRV